MVSRPDAFGVGPTNRILACRAGGRWRHTTRSDVAIARAMALRPPLLIADEPTSAFDVSMQAAALDLLRRLQRQLSFTRLFICYEPAVVDVLRDRVVVFTWPERRAGCAREHSPARVRHSARRLFAAAPWPTPGSGPSAKSCLRPSGERRGVRWREGSTGGCWLPWGQRRTMLGGFVVAALGVYAARRLECRRAGVFISAELLVVNDAARCVHP